MITTAIEFNLLPQLAAEIPAMVQARVDAAAEMFRERLKVALATREHGIGPDTGALIESLSIETPFGSDYDERLAAAATAYLSNPSRWADLIRAHVAPSAYTAAHLEARTAPPEPLEATEGEAIAAVSTMLAWGSFWEFGHQNEFTGKYEHRPWMGPEADLFAAEAFSQCFFDLLGEGEA